MKTFRVMGTNHASFTVSSLDRAIPFSGDRLGFDPVSRAPRRPERVARITGVAGAQVEIAFLSGSGQTVELIEHEAQAERGRVEARPCDAGFARPALDVDDVDAAIAAAGALGVYPIAPPVTIDHGPNRGRKVVNLGDADGETIELIEAQVG